MEEKLWADKRSKVDKAQKCIFDTKSEKEGNQEKVQTWVTPGQG